MKNLVLIILLSFVICSCKKEPVDNMVVEEIYIKSDSLRLINSLDSIYNIFQKNKPKYLDEVVGKYKCTVKTTYYNTHNYYGYGDTSTFQNVMFEIKKHPYYLDVKPNKIMEQYDIQLIMDFAQVGLPRFFKYSPYDELDSNFNFNAQLNNTFKLVDNCPSYFRDCLRYIHLIQYDTIQTSIKLNLDFRYVQQGPSTNRTFFFEKVMKVE